MFIHNHSVVYKKGKLEIVFKNCQFQFLKIHQFRLIIPSLDKTKLKDIQLCNHKYST